MKNVTTHTPGPWHIVRMTNVPSPEAFVVRGEDQNSSAIVSVIGEANARLIAAAPELLEAVKAVQRLIDTNSGQLSASQALRADEILRAAIAKAEGRDNRCPHDGYLKDSDGCPHFDANGREVR
mgnify:CR=1 FL=1